MEWIEARIFTTSEGVDALCARLMDLGAGAVQIEDANEMADFIENNPLNWDYVDDELLNRRNEEVYVQVYLTSDTDGEKLLKNIAESVEQMKAADYGIDMGRLLLESRVRDESEWVDNWKKHYKPIEVGQKIVIKPEWEHYENKNNKIVFNINPGHLFGTGLHQTTQLCIAELEKYVQSDTHVLDLGCGTGILSIISLMLGAQSAFAADIEPGCVNIAAENAAMNHVSMDCYTVRSGNVLYDEELISEIKAKNYGAVVANIVADVIIGLLPFVRECMLDDGVFVASGIIVQRLDDVLAALAANNFSVVETINKDDWVCVVSKKG